MSMKRLRSEFNYFNAIGSLDNILVFETKDGKQLTSDRQQARRLSACDGFIVFRALHRNGLQELNNLEEITSLSSTTLKRYFTAYTTAIAMITHYQQPYPSHAAIRKLLSPDTIDALGLKPGTAMLIGDATERPTSAKWRLNYSKYKQKHTIKHNVVIAINGYVCDISPGYTGSISDNDLHTKDGTLECMAKAMATFAPQQTTQTHHDNPSTLTTTTSASTPTAKPMATTSASTLATTTTVVHQVQDCLQTPRPFAYMFDKGFTARLKCSELGITPARKLRGQLAWQQAVSKQVRQIARFRSVVENIMAEIKNFKIVQKPVSITGAWQADMHVEAARGLINLRPHRQQPDASLTGSVCKPNLARRRRRISQARRKSRP
eukprot:m.350094 g.350094  ORF g.350094 m.350094 type:complete len:378 (+) comp16157_c0_seq5:491-1624(+)